MIDQPSPPFATGDTAYTAPAPGGYASAAAVPTDPAFGGSDAAYAAPSLGGEFQPGSGKAAPTSSPISKGADADGGAADIAAVPRIDEPTPPTPPTPAELTATVTGNDIVFEGVASADMTGDVEYEANDDGVARHVAGIVIPEGTTAGTAAAIVANRVNSATHTAASVTSNQVHVTGKTPNVVVVVGCTLA